MMGGNIPTIRNSKTGVVIRHKEFLGDVVGSNAFRNQIFPINPGMAITFPWLSQIANSFEQYEWRGMVFTFKSTSSDQILASANNTSIGTVILATQYDVKDKPFANKVQMENHQYSVSNKPSLDIVHPIECARGQSTVTRLFTRNSAPPADADLRLYDLGNLNLAVNGMQGAQTTPGNIGELWVSYEVKFFKPQLYDYLGLNQLFDRYDSAFNRVPSGANGLLGDLNAAPSLIPYLPDTRIPGVGSNIGTRITQSNVGPGIANLVVTFPPYVQSGVFKVQYFVKGGVNTAGIFSFPGIPGLTFANCTGLNGRFAPVFSDPTAVGFTTFQSPSQGQAADAFYFESDIQLTGPYSNPLAGVANSTATAFFTIEFAFVAGAQDIPFNGGSTLLITQINPHEANVTSL